MNNFLSFHAQMYYENILHAFKTRLITIDTKEKSKHFQSEITILKMMIVLISNLLREDKKGV